MRSVVSCDWLALSCLLGDARPNARIPFGCRLERQGETAVWRVREFLLDERGAKVATYLREPKSAILDCRRMVIEIANEWLYNALIISILDMVLNVYPCVVTGMPRFDICMDAELDAHAREVRDGLTDGSIYKTASQTGVVWYTQNKAQREPHQLSWGAPESTFHWKLYNKWKELHAEGGCSKPYIEEQWVRAGLNPRRVWRLECSVSDSPKLAFLDGDLSNKIRFEDVIIKRVPMFQDLYDNRFVLRRNEGHSNKSRDTRVYLWPLDVVGKSIGYAKPESRQCTEAERRLLRKLCKEYMQKDKSAIVIDALEYSIGLLLQQPQLLSMWMEITGMTDRETHMRFPLSLNVPADRRNIRQLQLPINELPWMEPDPNAIDHELDAQDKIIARITEGFHKARPSE